MEYREESGVVGVGVVSSYRLRLDEQFGSPGECRQTMQDSTSMEIPCSFMKRSEEKFFHFYGCGKPALSFYIDKRQKLIASCPDHLLDTSSFHSVEAELREITVDQFLVYSVMNE